MKRSSIVLATLLALAAVLAACGSLRTDHVVTGAPSGPRHGPVRVLMETDTVPPTFQEIGLVRARGEGNRANLESVITGLQDEAREIGANAVVRVRIDQGSGSVSAVGTAGTL